MFEVLIIVVLLLVIFGAGKVRNAGSDLGAAVKGFRKSLTAPQPERPATPTEPDAEFPEVLAARARGSGKPGAPGA
jgi:sec-independent protein translocase protein TatA